MPKESSNIEKPKIEIGQSIPESNLENLNISRTFETNQENSQEKQQNATQTPVLSQPIISISNQPSQEQILDKQIESILEADLKDLYINMPKQKQEEFKKRGEIVISEINILLKDVKIKIKKILSLIIEWLSIIPGVSKVFLKQEAKIKTDKIIELKNQQK